MAPVTEGAPFFSDLLTCDRVFPCDTTVDVTASAMKLTIEDNPETIKRYAHFKPAPPWGAERCGARCPGTSRTCTLEKGHRGHHVAHGGFNRVVAVWDAGSDIRKRDPRAEATLASDVKDVLRRGGLVALWQGIRNVVPSLETAVFLILFAMMVGFGIHWILMILGGPPIG